MTNLRRIALALLGAAVAGALLSGCTADSAGQNNGKVRTRQYDQDGYLGQTDAYPRIPGREMTATYANDKAAMWEAVRQMRGVEGMNVTFQGADAYITLYVSEELEPRERPSLEREVASVLRFNFPRYTIHMNAALPASRRR